MEKQIVGSIFGSANIHSDIPKLLKLYREGQLDLDSMITNTYKLGDINQGYQDMRDGKNIRGRPRLRQLTAGSSAPAGAAPAAARRRRRAHVAGGGADEAVVRGLLHHVGAPPDRASDRERRGEHLAGMPHVYITTPA